METISNRVQQVRDAVERLTGTPISLAAAQDLVALMGMPVHEPESSADQGGIEPREVTILLADLRGFMALTATLPAGTVIGMLNRCLDLLSTTVYRHLGTIDKFMGDALMALFGIPELRDDDVPRALACAVEMQTAVRDLNTAFKAEGLPELHLGIGINTGTVMAGRFGSSTYSAYTVIGEEVNLASRIEAFSLRGQVLISENTYARCAALVTASEPMQVHVKGKKDPVRLRELVGIPGKSLLVPRQEIRRSHRVEVRLPCTFHRIHSKIVMEHIEHAIIRDIGYHGVLVELDEDLDDRGEVKLAFNLPLVDFQAAEIYARVVNQKRVDGVRLAGLEFTSLDLLANEKIQVFVQLLVLTR